MKTSEMAKQLSGIDELTSGQLDRFVRLVKKYNQTIVDFLTGFGPANPGETYDNWMSRAGAEFKLQRAEKRENYTPRPQQKVRGYYTNEHDDKCREYIGFGGTVVNEIVQDHRYDQEVDLNA